MLIVWLWINFIRRKTACFYRIFRIYLKAGQDISTATPEPNFLVYAIINSGECLYLHGERTENIQDFKHILYVAYSCYYFLSGIDSKYDEALIPRQNQKEIGIFLNQKSE